MQYTEPPERSTTLADPATTPAMLLAKLDAAICEAPRGDTRRALICFIKALQLSEIPTYPDGFNRTIWFFWDDGEAQAPELVRTCLARWRCLNPDFAVRVLANSGLDEFFPDWREFQSLPVAAFCDLLRVRLLTHHGGIWSDATVYPTVPLSWWLPAALTGGFFAFSWGQDLLDGVPTIDAMAPNWFLAANVGHPIATTWYHALASKARDLIREAPALKALVLTNGKTISAFAGTQYWWSHQAFTALLHGDSRFRLAWLRCAEWPAQVPLLLGGRRRRGKPPPTGSQLPWCANN